MITVRTIREAATHNFLLKLFSLLFAVGLWAFVNFGARDAEKSLFVALELRNIPDDLIVTNNIADGVDVRLRGARTLIGPIEESRVRFWLDLSRIHAGISTISIEPEQLSLPQGVRITRLSPAEIPVRVEKLGQRMVRVELSSEIKVPEGYRLVDLEIVPAQVRVIGPVSKIQQLSQVRTRLLTLSTTVGNVEELVDFEDLSPLLRTVPERAVVRGRLEETLVSIQQTGVPVQVRNSPGPYRLEPPSVAVSLRGPARILDRGFNEESGIWIDLKELSYGPHVLPVIAEYPAGVEIEEIMPRTVTVTLLEEDS